MFLLLIMQLLLGDRPLLAQYRLNRTIVISNNGAKQLDKAAVEIAEARTITHKDIKPTISKNMPTPVYLAVLDAFNRINNDDAADIRKITKAHGKKPIIIGIDLKTRDELNNEKSSISNALSKIASLYEKPSSDALKAALVRSTYYTAATYMVAYTYYASGQLPLKTCVEFAAFNIAVTFTIFLHVETIMNLQRIAREYGYRLSSSIFNIELLIKKALAEKIKLRSKGISEYSTEILKNSGVYKERKLSNHKILEFLAGRGDALVMFIISTTAEGISRGIIGHVKEFPSLSTSYGWLILLLNGMGNIAVKGGIQATIAYARDAGLVTRKQTIWLSTAREIMGLTRFLPLLGVHGPYNILSTVMATSWLVLGVLSKKYPVPEPDAIITPLCKANKKNLQEAIESLVLRKFNAASNSYKIQTP